MSAKEKTNNKAQAKQKQRPQQSKPLAFETQNQDALPQGLMQRTAQDPGSLTTKDVLYLQRKLGNQAVNQMFRRGPNKALMRSVNGKQQTDQTQGERNRPIMRETITFDDDEVDVIQGDPNAKTWEKYIEQYNSMINVTIRNLRDSWQDGVNTFETQMQFPAEGETQAKIGEAILKAATSELVGYLIGEINTKYPGVGTAIGAIKAVVTAIYDEQKRAEDAAASMSLGNFIVNMRTGMGNMLNDLAAQSALREDALRSDFTTNHLGKDTEYEKVEFYKGAIQELSKIKAHSQPITRSLAETWIAENFKQESNWLGQMVTTGVIELKYEVSEEAGMKIYSYKHCKVRMPQGDRVAKAINATYEGQPIDLKSFKCNKMIILSNTDDRYRSESGTLDKDNRMIGGRLGTFGWYNNMPRGLVVGKFDES